MRWRQTPGRRRRWRWRGCCRLWRASPTRGGRTTGCGQRRGGSWAPWPRGPPPPRSSSAPARCAASHHAAPSLTVHLAALEQCRWAAVVAERAIAESSQSVRRSRQLDLGQAASLAPDETLQLQGVWCTCTVQARANLPSTGTWLPSCCPVVVRDICYGCGITLRRPASLLTLSELLACQAVRVRVTDRSQHPFSFLSLYIAISDIDEGAKAARGGRRGFHRCRYWWTTWRRMGAQWRPPLANRCGQPCRPAGRGPW